MRQVGVLSSERLGRDLSGANLIAADLGDADVRGDKLDGCLFLTQSQINVAKGNQETKIPTWLSRPSHW